MGRLGQMFPLLMYSTAVQDRFKRWIDCASQYSPSLATDSTDTAEFIKCTMTQKEQQSEIKPDATQKLLVEHVMYTPDF